MLFIVVCLCLTSQLVSTTEHWQNIEILCAENETDDGLLSKLNNLNGSNITVTINCTTVNLTNPVEISNINGLRIKGSGQTTIRCTSCFAVGLNATNISNLHLESLNIHKSSVMISDCTNVTIKSVTIGNSTGTGMRLHNNTGTITIENCTFRGCAVDSSKELNQYTGGGLGIKQLTKEKTFILLRNCIFLNNIAYFGAGMAIILKSTTTDIAVENTIFCSNIAQIGGGVLINRHKGSNSITFKNCSFENNKAVEGGGTSVILRRSGTNKSSLNFMRCLWLNNYRQAINLRKEEPRRNLQFILVFDNCNFTRNGNVTRENEETNAFVITDLSVQFVGMTVFESNFGSAIKAISSTLNFKAFSRINFVGNKGIKGGALQLLGHSVMKLEDSVTLEFRNNTAKKGGAIYVDSSKFVLVVLQQPACFLKLNKRSNISITFRNNNIEEAEKGHKEDSLYVKSLLPCLQTKTTRDEFVTLTHIMNFDKHKVTAIERQFTTAAHHFAKDDEVHNHSACPAYFNNESELVINENTIAPKQQMSTDRLIVIPGKTYTLNLKLIGELCMEVSFHVSVRIKHSTMGTLGCEPVNIVIHAKSITFYGYPQDIGKIELEDTFATIARITIDYEIDECPPGYTFEYGNRKCKCAEKKYIGVWGCQDKEFRACVKHGYWVGYSNDDNRTQDTLASAICPQGFCKEFTSRNHSATDCNENLLLPPDKSANISSYVCSEHRSGILCGACKDGYSAHYHSKLFSCKSNDSCCWGWLWYILSELIPVTLLFLVIIFFNISFTSGPLNGVILFMQLVDTLKINAENAIKFNEDLKIVSNFYKIVYQMFTLNFFVLDEDLSFCLWRGTSALDMLAFRYVTITYSLLLVIATIVLLRMCSPSRRMLNLKRSIIHGLSAFLVMSYSECTRVSLSIITVSTLHVGPNSSTDSLQRHAFYNGQYPYMKKEHIRYALPAIFFLLTLVAIPPLLLIAYPLCYKLFAFFRIEESRCVQITCKIFPLEKAKPLFDSMQGAFKDRFRFFAGLYFLFRLITNLTFVYTKTLRSYYAITGIQLIGMCFLHAICHPYKKTWHNILDATFFLLLGVINMITFNNFELLSSNKKLNDVPYLISAFSNIQCILILLPLVYLLAYTVYCIAIKLSGIQRCRLKKQKEHDDSDYILHELDTRSIDE